MTMDRQPSPRHVESGSRPAHPDTLRPDGSIVASVECITLEAEVPEVLFRGMREFLDAHPQWDQYSVISYALAGFLFQNGCQNHHVTQHYLDGLFLRP
jgi:hypothetical protein